VVIPLYNKEQYIYRALESVIKQETPPDEILVVDDGSTDGSVKEARRISDPRIRVIQQKNAGEAAARNRGIEEASCELISFLDADDEWKPEFLTHIQKLVNEFPDCGAYATAYQIIESNGRIIYPRISGVPPTPWIGIIPNWFKIIQKSILFNTSSIAIPKRVCQELGGFPTDAKRGIDIMMWVRLSVRYPIAYSPAPLHIYHREAINRGCVTIPILEEPACAKMMVAMLKNNEVPDSLVMDFKDYYSLILINKSKDLIKAGQSRFARDLLTKVSKNRRYFFRALSWFCISWLPFSVIKFYMKARNGK
jgi:glycosyltransferase involved in cell wall biosynthesis